VAAVLSGALVVLLSWALVNTVFALKYARLYYSGGDGGIDFGQREPPAYSDFAYGPLTPLFPHKSARLSCSGGAGGIDFGQREPPAYSDFAYVAFTVGMSFAVPDTQLAQTSIRKVALGHALLSFLFGTIVIAVAVNLVTNL